jgi:hypothetical protein
VLVRRQALKPLVYFLFHLLLKVCCAGSARPDYNTSAWPCWHKRSC